MLDSTNLASLYLLAEFRYENGMENDAHYLTQKLFELDNENKEIKRLLTSIQEKYGALKGDLPTLKEFMMQNVSYYDEE